MRVSAYVYVFGYHPTGSKHDEQKSCVFDEARDLRPVSLNIINSRDNE